MKQKVSIITGASGEIGQNLISRFNKEENKKIIALDLNHPNKKLNIYKFIKGSILDQEVINQLSENYIIEEIFHLAAVLSTKAEQNPDLAKQVNINGTLNLFNLALFQNLKHKIITKFFFPSSIAVYNTNVNNQAIDENSYCNPITIYGQHKLFCENLGVAFDLYGNEQNLKIDFRSIRFPGIISTNTIPTGGTSDYAPQMIHNAFNNKNYTCFVNKNTCLPFIVMPDAIDSIIQLMNENKKSLHQNVYNITAFNPTVTNLFYIIKTECPNFKITYNIDEMRQKIVDSWPDKINDNNAKKDWNWEPTHNLKKAFNDYIIPHLRK
jgi:threonine 3-dehydrogenase